MSESTEVHATVAIVNATAAAQDAVAQRAADERAAKAPAKREPPSWATLADKAAALKLRITGPIKPNNIASAGLERLDGRRVIGCQAIDWDGLLPDQQDRLLRCQLASALWLLEGG